MLNIARRLAAARQALITRLIDQPRVFLHWTLASWRTWGYPFREAVALAWDWAKDPDSLPCSCAYCTATTDSAQVHADTQLLFTSRPVTTLECSCCKGSGSKPRAYCLHFDEETASSEPANVIPALVGGGAVSIFDATNEAADLAKRSGRSVVFAFNGKRVIVSPTSDPDQVARTWWMDTYNETPEQSVARR